MTQFQIDAVIKRVRSLEVDATRKTRLSQVQLKRSSLGDGADSIHVLEASMSGGTLPYLRAEYSRHVALAEQSKEAQQRDAHMKQAEKAITAFHKFRGRLVTECKQFCYQLHRHHEEHVKEMDELELSNEKAALIANELKSLGVELEIAKRSLLVRGIDGQAIGWGEVTDLAEVPTSLMWRALREGMNKVFAAEQVNDRQVMRDLGFVFATSFDGGVENTLPAAYRKKLLALKSAAQKAENSDVVAFCDTWTRGGTFPVAETEIDALIAAGVVGGSDLAPKFAAIIAALAAATAARRAPQ